MQWTTRVGLWPTGGSHKDKLPAPSLPLRSFPVGVPDPEQGLAEKGEDSYYPRRPTFSASPTQTVSRSIARATMSSNGIWSQITRSQNELSSGRSRKTPSTIRIASSGAVTTSVGPGASLNESQ